MRKTHKAMRPSRLPLSKRQQVVAPLPERRRCHVRHLGERGLRDRVVLLAGRDEQGRSRDALWMTADRPTVPLRLPDELARPPLDCL